MFTDFALMLYLVCQRRISEYINYNLYITFFTVTYYVDIAKHTILHTERLILNYLYAAGKA